MSWVVFLHPIVLSVIFEANDKKIYSMVPKVSQANLKLIEETVV
jgi:hypothetical protein